MIVTDGLGVDIFNEGEYASSTTGFFDDATW